MSHTIDVAPSDTRTANDRFKDSFRQWFWGAMIAATAFHFAVFALFPELTAADVSRDRDDVDLIPIPEFELPPPPKPLPRPANPVVTGAPIDEDITIAPNSFEAFRAGPVGPPAEKEEALDDQPQLTPYTVAPTMMNGREVERTLEREYPGSLRNAGLGGDVVVWLYIDTLGVVRDQQVREGSGYPSLDEAALNVAKVARFTPAQNLDRKVPVWVSQVITFRSR